LVEQVDELLGTADHAGADPHQREYGGDIPKCYAWGVAIDSGVMRKERGNTGDCERDDAESGQDKWKRNQPSEQKTGSRYDCDEDGQIEIPCWRMRSE